MWIMWNLDGCFSAKPHMFKADTTFNRVVDKDKHEMD